MSTLELSSASFSIDGIQIVDSVDVFIETGRVTAIVGPNGAGKSTALRLLSGLIAPSDGQAILAGTDLATLARRELARRVTYVPQNVSADVAFTVRECVGMGRYCHRGRFEGETQQDADAIDAALATTDTVELAERWLNELSGGEAQRVMLARGLATESEYLLLDEPTANLDIDHALSILDICRRLADDGRAIVLALHDLNSVLRVADVVYVLSDGRVANSGSPGDALTPDVLAKVFRVNAQLATIGGETILRFDRLAKN